MESVLNDCLTPTNEMILNLIEIETSLINTNHPDFIGSADSLLNLFQEPDFIAKRPGRGSKDGNADGGDEGEEVIQGMDINDPENRAFTLMDKPGQQQQK